MNTMKYTALFDTQKTECGDAESCRSCGGTGAVPCCYPTPLSRIECDCGNSGGFGDCSNCNGRGYVCDHEAHCPECGQGTTDDQLAEEGMCQTCEMLCVRCEEREGRYHNGEPVCAECIHAEMEHKSDTLEDR